MSQQTTNLGPQVSMGTSLAHGDLSVGTFHFPSWSSVTAEGSVWLQAARTYPRTGESFTSVSLRDGEIAIGLTVSDGTIYVRSGVTTYQWASDATTVI